MPVGWRGQDLGKQWPSLDNKEQFDLLLYVSPEVIQSNVTEHSLLLP